MSQKKDLLNEHRKMQVDAVKERKKRLKAAILKDLRETVNGFKHILPDNNKDAWRSILYYLKRFRRVTKTLQDEINNPDTPDDVRKFRLGKLAGIKQMMDFPRLVLQYKRTLENDEETNKLAEFMVQQHMQKRRG